VDAIQSLTGCTFGKGNLIHRDYGKNSYTFIRHCDGKAVRISTRPDGWPPDPPERQALFEKVRAGTATEGERRRMQELQDERALAVLTMPEARLFDVREVLTELPQSNRGIASAPCDGCGELTRATHLHRIGDRALCGACLEGVGSGEARR
jgi:formylmethanofuran dehydrogenase subunit E